MKQPTEYEKQVNDFLLSHNVTIGAKYGGHHKYFPDDPTPRAVFLVTIEREGRKPYSFTFGQSLVDSYEGQDTEGLGRWSQLPQGADYAHIKDNRLRVGKMLYNVRAAQAPPTSYDILAAITKSDPGDFDEFCSEFGYNTDSKKDTELYLSVVKEWKNIERLFGDCLDELQEIN